MLVAFGLAIPNPIAKKLNLHMLQIVIINW